MKILKFSADWCTPCKHLSATITKLKDQFPGLEIEEVDFDTNPELNAKYGIKSVPVLVSENGELRLTGNAAPSQVRGFLAEAAGA